MTFDFNLKKDPKLTIEARFCRENTNDLGEPLLPQTAHIIITEFRKFFFLLCVEILTRKRKGTKGPEGISNAEIDKKQVTCL